MYLELDECCYSYASVPRNETFCVPNGEQVQLNCIIVNPRDNFTNVTVTWFRSTTEDMSEFDEISSTSEEYRFSNFVSGSVANLLSLINCSHELYRDTFLLAILHFTPHKNGYYWCQLSINNTLVQPSYRVQFSAGNCSTMNLRYYRLANLSLSENRCAKYVATESDTGFTTTHELSGTSFVASSTESSTRLSTVTQQERESDKTITYAATGSDSGVTTTYKVSDISDCSVTSLTESTRNVTTESDAGLTRSSSVTQQEKESDKLIIYVAGSLSALVMIFGALIIVLSVLYLCKFHNRVTSKSQLIIRGMVLL